MADTTLRATSRRLRDLCEPIAGSVYFVSEAQDAYRELGFSSYGESYFCSRGACLGRPDGEVVAAAFGVFNPAVVIPSVAAGWTKTDAATLLGARLDAATTALRRILADADVSAPAATLRRAMESVDYAGRALFAGLRSLTFPDDPVGQLWRVCDYVRERRGDGHIAAWVSAGCDAVEISVLTELYWGLEHGRYIFTRGWTQDDVRAGVERLQEKGYLDGTNLTDAGLAYRRAIEATTDAMDADVVKMLGDDIDDLFAGLEPLQRAVLEAKAYPVNPDQMMSADRG